MKSLCSKRWLLVGALVALPVLGAGCSDNDEGDESHLQVESDGEIAQVVKTANEGEIQHAQAALKRQLAAEARAFAERMVTEHEKAQDDLDRVTDESGISAQESEVSQCLQVEADGLLTTIQSLPDDAFDIGYMSAQVVLHQRVLDLMDKQLIPDADDDALHSYLEGLRPDIEDHLEEAQRVLDQLGEKARD